MIDDLQYDFGIPGAVEVSAGIHGLPRVTLTHRSGARAEVYLHGAHVTSWTSAAGDELFFLSRESSFAANRPIRGGIPVIFPQFGGGVLPPHGLARISDWTLTGTGVNDAGAVSATLQLTEDAASLSLWPHPFTLALDVTLRETALTVAMQVANPGTEPFDYHAVLHTYFRVADIRRTALYGLRGVTFIDSLRDDLREVETRDAIRFAEETDRIYAHAPDHLRLSDEGNARTITIEKACMPDVVVWNPWIAKAQRMPDFGDDEYPDMLCVETGIMVEQHTLPAGAQWRGETTFTQEH